MKISKTSRGFRIAEFKDGNGVACSIQESSAAEQPMLWLGVEVAEHKVFTPGIGWRNLPLPSVGDHEILMASARMHLTQKQVQDLLPHLLLFAQCGVLELQKVSETCRKTGYQACHICDDGECCDNQNKAQMCKEGEG